MNSDPASEPSSVIGPLIESNIVPNTFWIVGPDLFLIDFAQILQLYPSINSKNPIKACKLGQTKVECNY